MIEKEKPGVRLELTGSIYTESLALIMLLLKLCISDIDIKPKGESTTSN